MNGAQALFKNDENGILNVERGRVRQGDPNEKMLSLLKLDAPSIVWLQLAEGMGIPATHADSAEAFHQQIEKALGVNGPRLIEPKPFTMSKVKYFDAGEEQLAIDWLTA